eukprot:gene11868-11956_t
MYSYHRATGTRLEPPHVFGSPEFLAALEAANNKLKTKTVKGGTLGALIASYRASPDFTTLGMRTRTDYEKILTYLNTIAAMPLSDLSHELIAGMRDKAFKDKKRWFANYLVTVTSIVLSHGLEHGFVKINYAKGVRKVKQRVDAREPNMAWTDAERDFVISEASIYMRGPIAVARWTGLRKGDILMIPKTVRQGDAFVIKTKKTGKTLTIPIMPALLAILDEMPKHDAITYFANSFGTPWTADGFTANFFKLLRKLADDNKIRAGLTFHGLRTSFAQEADALDLSEREIADAMAHSSTKTTKGYIREGRATRNVDKVIRLIGANKTRSNVVNISEKSVNIGNPENQLKEKI